MEFGIVRERTFGKFQTASATAQNTPVLRASYAPELATWFVGKVPLIFSLAI
jgi:hypothetical protein